MTQLHHRAAVRYAAEVAGTALLIVVGCGSAMVSAATHRFGSPGIALAFGGVVAVIILLFGHISGAHINPAVTIVLATRRRFPWREVSPYLVSQCVGAVLGAQLLHLLAQRLAGASFATVLLASTTVPSVSVTNALLIEGGWSALLGLAVFTLGDIKRAHALFAPAFVGTVVFFGALLTGSVTGGSFNPARSLGPAIVTGTWTAHWIYWVAPIGGMLLASQLYSLVAPRVDAWRSSPHT